jgi:hypothetical protein
MGAVLQKRIKRSWQPLTFFSEILNPAYDRELLAL